MNMGFEKFPSTRPEHWRSVWRLFASNCPPILAFYFFDGHKVFKALCSAIASKSRSLCRFLQLLCESFLNNNRLPIIHAILPHLRKITHPYDFTAQCADALMGLLAHQEPKSFFHCFFFGRKAARFHGGGHQSFVNNVYAHGFCCRDRIVML
jgi:hypothetical protein